MSLELEERMWRTGGAETALRPRRAGADRKIGRVDVHDTLAGADEAWRGLEDACPGTIYQTRRFILPWLATLGAASHVTPMIIVAHDSAGAPVAVLPFGVHRAGPVRIAGFLGGSDSNANVGLFRPGFDLGSDDLHSLLRAVAAKTRPRPDLFLLVNQPATLAGAKNPLDVFAHQPSASFCHFGSLRVEPAVWLKERLSKDTAKKLRKKRKRLEDMGALTHDRPRTALEVARVLDAFFALKLARFRQKNIQTDFEKPQARSYLERACTPRPERAPSIDLHTLSLDGRIIAIFAGAVYRKHLHLMFNAFDMDEEFAKSSPGDLLLQTILEEACREGIESFDLGIGEARYKNTWCDHAEPMFDSVLAITPLGRAYSAAESARRHAKHWIKQSEWAWPIAQKLLRRT